MKKLITVCFVIVLCAAACLTGCFNNTKKKTEVDIEFDPDKSVTLTLAVSNDPNEKLIAEAFANAYTVKYPKKKVDVVVKPGDYVNTLVFDYNAGILEDLMWMGDDNLTYLADLEVLMNLSDFIKAEEDAEIEDPFDEELYYASMMQMGRIKLTGDYYMFPRDYNKNVIFYNKTLLNTIGADIPEDNDWNWADFKEYVEHVTAKLIASGKPLGDGYEALEGANLDWKAIVYPMLKSHGGTFLDSQGKPAFNTPAMLQTLTDIGWFAQNGHSQPIGQTGGRGSFVAGKAAMYIGSRPTVGALLQRNINFGVVAYPQTGTKTGATYDNPLVGSGTTGYGINNTCEYPGDAWNFLRFIMSEDGQLAFSKTGSCVPVLKSMAEEDDAEWRKYPAIGNTDAFVMFEERDCIIDIFNTAPAAKEVILMGNYAGMIMDVTNGTRAPQESINYYFEEINKAL